MQNNLLKLLRIAHALCVLAGLLMVAVSLPAQPSAAQEAYLKTFNPRVRDELAAVAISGDTAVIGSVHGNGDTGAAHVFVRNGTNWTQQAYLRASNAGSGDWFGQSVAISGDTIVVGAQFEDSSATGVNGNQNDNSAEWAGAAYVFVRNGTNWTQQAYLKASNTEARDFFGISVGVEGDTIVVGANWENSNATGVNGNQGDNSASDSGAVYVFVRNGSNWTQQAYLKASNTGAGDQFGNPVSISGDTVAVGAGGEDSNATGVNGNQSDNSFTDAGAAYVFVRNGTNWSQQAYVKASNTGLPSVLGGRLANDSFGPLQVSGDTLVVGAIWEDSNATGVNGDQNNNNASDSGAAYVFVRNGTNWGQQAYLKASNAGANDWFGSVSVSGDVVVVGAQGEGSSATGVNGAQNNNNAPGSGAAYVFVRDGTNWSQQAYLKASNTEAGDLFGVSVAVSGGTAVVVASREAGASPGVNGNQNDNSAPESGAGYVFTGVGLPCSNCPPSFISPPANQLVLPGTNVTLAAGANGTAPLHYQWRFQGTNILDATNATHSFTNVSLTNGHGNFSVVVSNEFGQITSTNAFVFVRIRPGIVTQPVTQTVLQGQNATFTCVATGAPPIYYRWSGTGITPFTNTTGISVFTNVQVSITNGIRCHALNAAGILLSANVSLIVIPDFDRDGMADSWEAQYGLNTNNAADALLDFDDDRMSNRDEYLAGTDATNASSVLKLAVFRTNGITLLLTAQSNIAYTVQFTEALGQGVWQKLADVPARPENRLESVTDSHPATNRIYRLVTPQQR